MACAPLECLNDEWQSDSEEITVIPETPRKAERELIDESESDEDHDGVEIVDVAGSSFMYRIPRFPVVTINLRQITLEAIITDGSTVVYDGFIREHSSLYGHKYPATIRVYESCFVEVGSIINLTIELVLSIYTACIQVIHRLLNTVNTGGRILQNCLCNPFESPRRRCVPNLELGLDFILTTTSWGKLFIT